MSDHRVLLVDDEEEFVAVLAERLGARGLQADTAATGPAALVKAGETRYDAILLDMAMPGMDGIETLERLLDLNPDLQVILLTGRATLEQAATAIKLGALDLLEKPADIDTLVQKIEDAATRRWSLEDRRIEEKVADIIRKKGW
ncbi:MAG: response regulator [Gemmatimonadetes bacterium]|jgi:two-component system, OmpR family, response regulator|nr:response regulator [Gemmatimonadota bacterium]